MFDANLGKLTSVTFNNRYAVNEYFQYYGYDADGRALPAPAIRVVGTLGDKRFGQVEIDGIFQSGYQLPGLISVNIGRTVSATFTENLDAYVGSSLLVIGSYANLRSPDVARGFASFPTPWTYVSVTYNFEPDIAAVPEPATWAMMLVGFGMVAGATRYRRRSIKIELA